MSLYTVSHGDKGATMMSPVPTNVQPSLLSGSTHEQFGTRGNITPIMSTPQPPHSQHAMAGNVRIEDLQHHHPSSTSANSTDPTRTQNHPYGTPTIPSNGFSTAHLAGPTQPPPLSIASSVAPIPSSAPVSASVPISGVSAAPIPPSSVTTPSLSSQSRNTATPSTPATNGRVNSRSAARRSKPTSTRKTTKRAPSRPAPVAPSSSATDQGFDRTIAMIDPNLDPSQRSSNATTLTNFNSTIGLSPTADTSAQSAHLGASLMAQSPMNSLNGDTTGTINTSMLSPPEGIYRNFDDLLRQVQHAAKEQGYGIVKLRTSNYRDGKPTRYDLVCDRGGVKYNSTAKKRNPSTRKVDCPWKAKAVCEVQLNNQWRFQVQDHRHNHEPRVQAPTPGVDQTPTNQFFRTLASKIDNLSNTFSDGLTRIETQLNTLNRRVEDMEHRFGSFQNQMSSVEARIDSIESQNRMDIPMDDMERGLITQSSMMPGSQPPETAQGGQNQMQFYTTG